LPAAPTPSGQSQIAAIYDRSIETTEHTTNDKINLSKLLNSLPHRLLELIWLSNVCLGGNTSVPRSLGQLLGGPSESVESAYSEPAGSVPHIHGVTRRAEDGEVYKLSSDDCGIRAVFHLR
jgi:hypothetical protein